jgi:predicted signal transduction protein with EAL and GGDEF domain
MFKHDHSAPVHSSRCTSRRLHPRPALPAMTLSAQPQVLLPTANGRPRHTHVRRMDAPRPQATVLELMAAELRIGELEMALSEARAAAVTDTLTGALNRRGFDDAHRRELARARRSGSPMALALIDLSMTSSA